MNSKHITLRIFFPVLLLCFSFTSQLFSQSADSLAGNWELIKSARQWDVDLRFEKNKNFYVQRHLSAKYDYQLKGDTLISFLQKTYPDSETIVDTSFITVKNDTIIRTYVKKGKTNSIYMIKDPDYSVHANEARNPLIGRWKWKYPSKDTAVEVFHKDQTWDFSVIGKKITGHYEIDKDTLTMIYDDKKNTKREHTFWIQENMMGIKDLQTNKEFLYRRTKQEAE